MRTFWNGLVLFAIAIAAESAAAEMRWSLTNPTGRTYQDEPVRLKVDLPETAANGQFVVTANGVEAPYQLDERDGKKWLWVAASLKEGEKIEYAVREGRPKKFPAKVRVEQSADHVTLDNGRIAVRVPAKAGGTVPGPIVAVKLPSGKWVGSSAWTTARKLGNFRATVVGDGTIFAKIRLQYDFEGKAGLYQNVPAFATVDVSLFPGQQHVVIEESHEMDRGDCWEFDAAARWDARQALCITHSRTPAHGGREIPSPTTLKTGQTRMGDTLLNLQPRWSQAFDEGWFFLCHNGQQAVGATVGRASQWHWPHNNLIEVKVKPSGDYAGLRCPVWKGRRWWMLLAGALETWSSEGAKKYVTQHCFQPLDKLHHDYILDWPGLDAATGTSKKPAKSSGFPGMDFYSSGMNPTSGLRGFGRNAMSNAGKQGNLSTLIQAQVFLDPDSYGSYWNFWSPENPNFFTDFNRCGIALVTQLKQHPRFAELAKLAEQKFQEDLFHSITLPGGAGQECPGYVAYAMGSWRQLAEVCKQHLGFDITRSPRFRAGASFLLHLSQPIGEGQRRCHPGGDTHPTGPDVMALAEQFGVSEDVKSFKTEELPGFGVVFRNRPGTGQETYLAFKSGPNRGHYHGDQLSFHYCAEGRQAAIDHMCSYAPRAGQEHMHNRVAFHTEKLPYANMDGFERVIALKTSADVDVAMGQVESERLRITEKLPPEEWDTYLPEERFAKPLQYRRTIVGLKNRGKDYFVIRDQHAGPKVKATYCLHVLSQNCRREGPRVDFGNLTLFCAAPREFAFDRHDWEFAKKDNKTGQVTLNESTKGVRLTAEGEQGEFITVLYPGATPPKIEPIDGGVRVGGDEVTFAGRLDKADETVYVAVRRDGKLLVSLTGKDIDMDRSQGEIGLFVPDAGYPFGEIPDWLIRQRAKVPEWAPAWARRLREHELKAVGSPAH
jgi:hypothetical protein